MNEKVAGIIRHVLTTAGGILAAKGHLEQTEVEALAGSVVVIVGIAWSVIAKKRAKKENP